MVLLFYGQEFVSDFGEGIKWDRSLKFFNKSSVVNGFDMPLSTTFESVSPCYSPQHDELSRTYVGLKGQHFPLSLTVKGVGSNG